MRQQGNRLSRPEVGESALVKEAKDVARGLDADPSLVAMAVRLIQDRDDWMNRLKPVRPMARA